MEREDLGRPRTATKEMPKTKQNTKGLTNRNGLTCSILAVNSDLQRLLRSLSTDMRRFLVLGR